MKKIMFIVLLFLSFSAMAQDFTGKFKNQESFCLTDDSQLFVFFYNNIKFPAEAAQKKLEGTLMLSVDVQADSTITNIKTFSSLGYTIEDQAKELVKKLKFAPSVQNGFQVRSNLMMNVPIRAH